MTKLDRINANYEHDKAVLAKEDPMFAKNKFWDVGHAEGSGENELARNIRTKFVAEKINQQMDDILN